MSRSTAGMIARFDGHCARCDLPYRKGQDRIVRRGAWGHWIHAHCSSGADDE